MKAWTNSWTDNVVAGENMPWRSCDFTVMVIPGFVNQFLMIDVTEKPLNWSRPSERHICASKKATIGSNNGLSPVQHQVIIWPSDGLLLIGPMGIYFSEMRIKHIKCHWWKLIKKCNFAHPNMLIYNIWHIGFAHDPFQLIKQWSVNCCRWMCHRQEFSRKMLLMMNHAHDRNKNAGIW